MTTDTPGGGPAPPPVPPELAGQAARLDEIESWAADLEQKLSGSAATALGRQQAVADGIATTLQGAVGSRLAGLEMLRDKLTAKMRKQANKLHANAWTNAIPYGAVYPSVQEALYGLESGDTFGSMGLRQPGQTTAQGPYISTTGTDATPPPPPPPTYPPPPAPPATTGPHFPPIIDPWGGGGGIIEDPTDPTDPDPTPWQPLPDGGGIVEVPGTPPAPQPVPAGIPVSTSCGPAYMTFAANALAADYFSWAAAGAYGCTLVPADVPIYAAPKIPQGWCNLWGEDPTTGNALFQVWAPCGCNLYIPEGGGDAIICCGPPPSGYCYVYANNASGGLPPPGPPPVPPAGGGPEVCLTPQPPQCGPNGQPLPGAQLPQEGDHCDALNKVVDGFEGILGGLAAFFAIKTDTFPASERMPAILKWWFGTGAPILPGLVSRFFTWADGVVKELGEKLDCKVGALAPLVTVHAAVRVLEQYADIVPPQYKEFLRQAVNFACQSKLPQQPEADAAWLANVINDDTWKCWTKATGNLTDPASKVLDGKRRMPDPREIDLLYRRKYLTDEQYNRLTRNTGVINDEDKFNFHSLNDQWPGLQDVIRMMVRDVADPDAVRRAGLDGDFEKKWQGRLKQYGEALGVSEEIARYYWRAHWKLPSATQLFEMLHRLRPDAQDEFSGVTENDVREALKQDDMAPEWVEKLMAISYRVVTRVDARRMYTLHTIDDDQLRGYFQDEGYTAKDAQALVEFSRENRRVAELRAAGLPSVRSMVNAYARGEAGLSDLMEVAEQLLPQPEQQETAMEAAELARDLVNRRQQIAGIRRQYVSGLIGDDDTRQILVGIGVDPDQVEAFLFTWKIQKQKKGKEPSAAMLCKWRFYGIITAQQQAAALVNVGWAPADAIRIVKECEREIAEKEAKAAAAAAKEALKQQKAAEKAADQARKKAQQEAKQAAQRPSRNGQAAGAGP